MFHISGNVIFDNLFLGHFEYVTHLGSRSLSLGVVIGMHTHIEVYWDGRDERR
jgi:hypothetical protein